MTVQCIACVHFSLKGSELAQHGFGRCALAPIWERHPATFKRECEHHRPAPAYRVEAGIKWLEKSDPTKRAQRALL